MEISPQQDNTNKILKKTRKSNQGIEKIKRKYPCPYAKCDKVFNEKGNLQTHIRIHVRSYSKLFRQERNHMNVLTQVAERLSLLLEI